MLRPENGEDISLWAIDQAVSRFRKKLAEAGTDPELLKTIKKKGYIWSN
jgi:DNA-binding response OmpR family regulator